MNTQNKKMTLRKGLVIASLVLSGLLVGNSAFSQVHVNVGLYEKDYPGYTYYTYPSWHGHYRDRAYYAHYHARFEREHRAYMANRRFDHERYERETHWRDRHHD